MKDIILTEEELNSEIEKEANQEEPETNMNQKETNTFDNEPEEQNDPNEISSEPQTLDNDFKKIKLLDLFISLEKYSTFFSSSFKYIEYDNSTQHQLTIINNIYTSLEKVIEDLKFYIQNIYEIDDYNKNLYTYLLFNKRISELLSSFRATLQLNKENVSNTEEHRKK